MAGSERREQKPHRKEQGLTREKPAGKAGAGRAGAEQECGAEPVCRQKQPFVERAPASATPAVVKVPEGDRVMLGAEPVIEAHGPACTIHGVPVRCRIDSGCRSAIVAATKRKLKSTRNARRRLNLTAESLMEAG